MGDIADAMLDGTLCQSCGEYIGGDAGFPLFCGGCGGDDIPTLAPRKKKGGHARHLAKPESARLERRNRRLRAQEKSGDLAHELGEAIVLIGMLRARSPDLPPVPAEKLDPRIQRMKDLTHYVRTGRTREAGHG